MWAAFRNLPKWMQGILAIVGMAMVVVVFVLVIFLVQGDPYRGISVGPGGFQITPRQDPGLAKCQATSKTLSDVAASSAKAVSDLIVAEGSEAERVAVLRRKYIDEGIEDSAKSLGWSARQRYSSALSDTETEYQKIVAAREAAQKQQTDLLTKVNEINRVCGTLADPKK